MVYLPNVGAAGHGYAWAADQPVVEQLHGEVDAAHWTVALDRALSLTVLLLVLLGALPGEAYQQLSPSGTVADAEVVRPRDAMKRAAATRVRKERNRLRCNSFPCISG